MEMTDYMKLVDILLDTIPEDSPWQGNIKGLVETLVANGVTIPVRCEECKHWKNEINGCTEDKRFCDIGFYMVHKDGYCSFGEKKTENE
jgi:hypothetical protein